MEIVYAETSAEELLFPLLNTHLFPVNLAL